MNRIVKLFASAALLFAFASLNAADTPEPKTLMSERGKVLFSDDLTQQPGKTWKIAKGKWEINDGVLKGAELKADMHGAAMRHEVKFENAVIQFSFKLDGAKGTSLSINDAKGHNCRVSIAPTGFSVRKDSHDKNVNDKAAVLEDKKVTIKPGEWHTIVVEILGNEMVATLDGKETAFGHHDGVKGEKSNIGLTVAGETVSFKNFRMWEATPNKGWEATKTKLTEAKKVSK